MRGRFNGGTPSRGLSVASPPAPGSCDPTLRLYPHGVLQRIVIYTTASSMGERLSERRRIAIIQREIPHYRIRFFAAVDAEARRHEYSVTLYSGTEFPANTSLPFSHRRVEIRYVAGGTGGPYWMKHLDSALAGSGIIIAPHRLGSERDGHA